MIDIRPLNEVLRKKAIAELNEDPARIEKDIEALREWIRKSPHLKIRDDDQFLISFLRGSKNRMEKAKQKLDLFFSIKTHLPQIFRNRDLSKNPQLHSILKAGACIPLPLESPDAPRCILLRMGAYDPSAHVLNDVVKTFIMIFELLVKLSVIVFCIFYY